MNYAEKLKSFVGREGKLHEPSRDSPYYYFIPYTTPNAQTTFSILEVGDDFVVIQDNDDGRKLSIPLNIIVLVS
jgi:hypothetical protein